MKECILLNVLEGESMTIMAGSMAAKRRAWNWGSSLALTPDLQEQGRELIRNRMDL